MWLGHVIHHLEQAKVALPKSSMVTHPMYRTPLKLPVSHQGHSGLEVHESHTLATFLYYFTEITC